MTTAPVLRIVTPNSGVFFARAQDVENARANGKINVPLCRADGSLIVSGGRIRLRLTTIQDSDVQPVVSEPVQDQVQPPTATPTPAPLAPPKRTLWGQFIHWASGEKKREQEADEAKVREQAQNEAKRIEDERRKQHETQAQSESQRKREEFRASYIAKYEHAIKAVAVSQEPLVYFQIENSGRWHYAQREDWQTEWASRGGEHPPLLPLCDGQGEPLSDQEGKLQTVPIRDIEWTTLRAVAIQPVYDYTLPQDKAQEQVKERGRGGKR